jgi:hypothetical protein
VHGSNVRNLSIHYLELQLAKMLCLSIISYVFASTKLEKRAEKVLPRSEGMEGEMAQTMYAHRNT